MSVKPWMLPFLLALGGVILDYATTNIALGMNAGIYETHPEYNPVYALIIFWGAIAILTATLPKKKPWAISINGLALSSYLGPINNTLVMIGAFSGLVI